MSTLKRLWKEEEAATATEYAIIAAILAVGLIGALVGFKDKIWAMFKKAGDQVGGQ